VGGSEGAGRRKLGVAMRPSHKSQNHSGMQSKLGHAPGSGHNTDSTGPEVMLGLFLDSAVEFYFWSFAPGSYPFPAGFRLE